MKTLNRQQGNTLLVAMIMLVLITLIVINTVNLGSSSIQTVSNMQYRNQVTAAAEETLQEVISNTRFFTTPSAVFIEDCGGDYNAKCVDTNVDGVDDVTVTLVKPTCVQARVFKNNNLIIGNVDQAECLAQADQSGFGRGGAIDPSLCAQSIWEINAQATDSVTQASAVVTQGVSVIVPADKIDTSCPL